jgi:hypothetical protein
LIHDDRPDRAQVAEVARQARRRLLCEGNRILSLVKSSLAEIQRAIEKLAPTERSELRNWLDAQDIEESPEFLAAVDEGIRSAESEPKSSLEGGFQQRSWGSSWPHDQSAHARQNTAHAVTNEDDLLEAISLLRKKGVLIGEDVEATCAARACVNGCIG